MQMSALICGRRGISINRERVSLAIIQKLAAVAAGHCDRPARVKTGGHDVGRPSVRGVGRRSTSVRPSVCEIDLFRSVSPTAKGALRERRVAPLRRVH